jgi:hypothetical protein
MSKYLIPDEYDLEASIEAFQDHMVECFETLIDDHGEFADDTYISEDDSEASPGFNPELSPLENILHSSPGEPHFEEAEALKNEFQNTYTNALETYCKALKALTEKHLKTINT